MSERGRDSIQVAQDSVIIAKDTGKRQGLAKTLAGGNAQAQHSARMHATVRPSDNAVPSTRTQPYSAARG